MANPNNTANNVPSHYFHAEAHALSGKLMLPFEEQIKEQAFVKLEGESQKLLLEGASEELKRRKAQRNYRSLHVKDYRLEGIISYSAAHTQVSGHKSEKHKGAFVTLATSVVENLNVLNVVTADRVVGQISTTHFPDQYSPLVTFLGTHFENLRIARHPTLPELKIDFVGNAPKPKDEAVDKESDKYYPTRRTSFMDSVEKQYAKLREGLEEFISRLTPEHRDRVKGDDSWLSKHYHEFSQFNYEQLQNDATLAARNDAEAKAPLNNGDKWEGVTCSLVEHVEIEDIVIPVKPRDPRVVPPPIVIQSTAHCFGHVIHVPDFGTIFLAELKVNHNSFDLTMIRLELGCLASGDASVASCHVNGKGGGG